MSDTKTVASAIKLGGHDLQRFVEVIRLFEDVFEMENLSIPEPEYLQGLLAKNDFFVFAALLDNKVVGGLTAHVLDQYYSDKSIAYIYDLAVATEYQRQGIGRKLIAEIKKYCNEKGFAEVFVQAEKVDDYAVDFYRLTKPTAELEAVHFSYLLDKKK